MSVNHGRGAPSSGGRGPSLLHCPMPACHFQLPPWLRRRLHPLPQPTPWLHCEVHLFSSLSVLLSGSAASLHPLLADFPPRQPAVAVLPPPNPSSVPPNLAFPKDQSLVPLYCLSAATRLSCETQDLSLLSPALFHIPIRPPHCCACPPPLALSCVLWPAKGGQRKPKDRGDIGQPQHSQPLPKSQRERPALVSWPSWKAAPRWCPGQPSWTLSPESGVYRGRCVNARSVRSPSHFCTES